MQRMFSYRPSWVEVVGIIGTVLSTAWWLWSYEFSWGSILIAPLIIAFGVMAGDMVYRLGVFRW